MVIGAALAWFCHFDAINLDAAFTIIKGRFFLSLEPHVAISNGDALFNDFEKR
jgi:hypothetical protein